jgi:putative pyruvate formate lyase activating enzyme
MTNELYVARAALHMWEEPCISGNNGSGAVFFTGCPLGCVFCQNHSIAEGKAGKLISVERLSEIFLELQDKKANNINLVTPTHYIPQIIKAIDRAKTDGLKIPIVYNTSAYEKVETLRMLEGIVDVYLPDLKYMDPVISKQYAHAPDYFEYAAKALKEMYRQVGNPQFNSGAQDVQIEKDMMTRGMIVRHLLLPGCLKDSKNIIQYLYEIYGDQIYISIMNQYTPLPQVKDIPALNRRITQKEYDTVVDYAIDLGVTNGFIQEEGTAKESFIPEFDYEGV